MSEQNENECTVADWPLWRPLDDLLREAKAALDGAHA